MTALRIIVAVVGFFGAIFAPWWIPAACIVLLSLRFRAWEAIALGVFMDLLWFSPETSFHGLPLLTIGAIVIVWAFEPLRSEFLT
ncbi:MAG TPA: hypothetical protein VG102_04205 [Candidatus Paceibacterota bacterium]|jgi:hypothetical protein|nr:hypothetical protein [Candidatus Paceibacterota bacterium]